MMTSTARVLVMSEPSARATELAPRARSARRAVTAQELRVAAAGAVRRTARHLAVRAGRAARSTAGP